MYHLTTIHPDGSRTSAQQAEPPTLEQMQAAVGGYIETVPHLTSYQDRRCVAFCNEEGKLRGLEFNGPATSLWYASLGIAGGRDALVGDILIVAADSQSELARL